MDAARGDEANQLLLGAQDLGPAVLLVELGGHVGRAMLLQAALHAVDGRAADLEAAVDGGGVESGFQQFGLGIVREA